MSIIETGAPIAIEDLKKYFEDKETQFLINYEQSELKNEKLIIYLSNLDLPCDVINFDHSFINSYLNSNMMVSIPSVETVVIAMLHQLKNGIKNDIHNEELEIWERNIDSLTLYNLYCLQLEELDEWVESFPENNTVDLRGVNFLSLLDNDMFYSLLVRPNMSKLTYMSSYFNMDNNIFKGKNLYYYWANTKNPLFKHTNAVAAGYSRRYLEVLNDTLVQ